MTTPAEFLTYVTQALQYMDTQLAAGSAVLFAPLVDGRVLFNTLHNHTHPAGILYSDLCVHVFLFEPFIGIFALGRALLSHFFALSHMLTSVSFSFLPCILTMCLCRPAHTGTTT